MELLLALDVILQIINIIESIFRVMGLFSTSGQ